MWGQPRGSSSLLFGTNFFNRLVGFCFFFESSAEKLY